MCMHTPNIINLYNDTDFYVKFKWSCQNNSIYSFLGEENEKKQVFEELYYLLFSQVEIFWLVNLNLF